MRSPFIEEDEGTGAVAGNPTLTLCSISASYLGLMR